MGVVTYRHSTGQDILEKEEDKDTIKMSGDSGAVTTVGRDDFFNDPFFKDWWADFDLPLKGNSKQLYRQISGGVERMRIQLAILSLRMHSMYCVWGDVGLYNNFVVPLQFCLLPRY